MTKAVLWNVQIEDENFPPVEAETRRGAWMGARATVLNQGERWDGPVQIVVKRENNPSGYLMEWVDPSAWRNELADMLEPIAEQGRVVRPECAAQRNLGVV